MNIQVYAKSNYLYDLAESEADGMGRLKVLEDGECAKPGCTYIVARYDVMQSFEKTAVGVFPLIY